MTRDFVSEIYTSVQGEGPYTGEKQIFFRLAGCPLRCDYCDTPESLTAQGHPEMTVEDAIQKIQKESELSGTQTVSITGGEPLAHAVFLKELLPALKKHQFKIYLETAGIHSDALRLLLPFIDVIAMDIKLPSATQKSLWSEHQEFLKVGAEKIFVKIVLEQQSTEQEFLNALQLMKTVQPIPLLILQPVTSHSPQVVAPDPDKISFFFHQAKEQLPRVLVMPQQHKVWRVR